MSPGTKAFQWGLSVPLTDRTIVDERLGFVALVRSTVTTDIPGDLVHAVAETVVERYLSLLEGRPPASSEELMTKTALRALELRWNAPLSHDLSTVIEAIAAGIRRLDAHLKLPLNADVTLLRDSVPIPSVVPGLAVLNNIGEGDATYQVRVIQRDEATSFLLCSWGTHSYFHSLGCPIDDVAADLPRLVCELAENRRNQLDMTVVQLGYVA